MILKKSERIYQPTTPLEKNIQDYFHKYNNDWLNEKECQAVAKSIASIKSIDDWLGKDDLLSTRIEYFFAPEMTNTKDIMVFLTYPLFARDILENREIHSNLFNPITFVTLPLANFLFSDYPVHIYVDIEHIKRENKNKRFFDIGGLIISSNNVLLPKGCIEKIKVIHDDPETAKSMYSTILSIQKDADVLVRHASKKIAPGVFQIEETDRELYPDMKVLDKNDKRTGTIGYVDKGDAGDVVIEYEEGIQKKIPKSLFDHNFVVMASTNGVNIDLAIKQKLMKSRAIMNLFKDFGVSTDKLKELNIVIVDLHDRYAETDSKTMKLDKSLFENGDFFKNNFFVVCHEIVHWLTRMKEERAYFADEEEVQGFISAIAYELENNSNIEDVYNRVYPKVQWHFHDKDKAREFFNRMLEKAKQILNR